MTNDNDNDSSSSSSSGNNVPTRGKRRLDDEYGGTLEQQHSSLLRQQTAATNKKVKASSSSSSVLKRESTTTTNEEEDRVDDDDDTSAPHPPKKQLRATVTTAAAVSATPVSRTTRTVYIGGLHPRVRKPHLEKLLTKYGGTLERLDYHDDRSYAFGEYASETQAQTVMDGLHGKTLLGKTLVVRPAKSQQQYGRGRSRDVNTKASAAMLDSKIYALQKRLQKTSRR